MKKYILVFSLLFVLFSCKQNRDFSDSSHISMGEYDSVAVENLAVLCKVWGFLKYYHPKVAAGKYNWDYELFEIMPSVINAKSTSDRNKILYKWTKGLGNIKESKHPAVIDSANIKMYPDLVWTEDVSILGNDIVKLLSEIKNAERKDSCHYVGFVRLRSGEIGNPVFKNEEAYEKRAYPDTGYRLLSLFRYWNIIQYYFPYRYLIDDNWHDVLVEFIPQFIDAKNKLEYKFALLKLIARVSDTHANIWEDTALDEYRGLRCAPFEITFIEDKAVVTDYYKPINIGCNIQKGDVILSIDSVSTDSIIKKQLPYTPASNYPTKLRNIAMNLLRTNNEKLLIKYVRNSSVYSDSIFCPLIENIRGTEKAQKDKALVKMLDGDITYLYLGSTKEDSVPTNIQSKGLIIDLRCYPNYNKIKGYWDYNYLYPDSLPFVKCTYGSYIYPGMFTYSPALKAGKFNPDYYKGKKIILINEISQSHAEFMTMKYRCTPNTIVIGSTTAGADGNISGILLPGGIRTIITGIGIYYPDGTETQRIGIIPDIEIKPTIKGIREGRDEVLEKAIELINDNH